MGGGGEAFVNAFLLAESFFTKKKFFFVFLETSGVIFNPIYFVVCSMLDIDTTFTVITEQEEAALKLEQILDDQQNILERVRGLFKKITPKLSITKKFDYRRRIS